MCIYKQLNLFYDKNQLQWSLSLVHLGVQGKRFSGTKLTQIDRCQHQMDFIASKVYPTTYKTIFNTYQHYKRFHIVWASDVNIFLSSHISQFTKNLNNKITIRRLNIPDIAQYIVRYLLQDFLLCYQEF